MYFLQPYPQICTPSVIPWSHNTVAMLDSSAAEAAQWQIWHIGDGIVSPSVYGPCFNKSEVGGETKQSSSDITSDQATVPHRASSGTSLSHSLTSRLTGPDPGNTVYVAYAAAPGGPWMRALNNSGVPINATGAWGSFVGNPAPLMMPDGSINLYFTARPCPPNSGALVSNCIAMATSTTGWAGPFQMKAAQNPITFPESEDPSVFRDPRGNYHLLTNVNTGHKRCPQGVQCGGHAWSRDGITFTNLTIGAFGPYITFANGTGWPNAYVERPLVTQDSLGRPLAFHVGMGRSTYMDSCNWVQLFCTGAAGEKCGPTIKPPPPPPPPPVHLQNGGLCLGFNTSAFPCSGLGPAAGCPVSMLPCGGAGTMWVVTGTPGTPAPIQSAWADKQLPPGTVLSLDVDCDGTANGTVVKLLASGPAPLTVGDGVIGFNAGKENVCLNSGQGVPRPVCGPKTEVIRPDQIKITPCSSPDARGWVIRPV